MAKIDWVIHCCANGVVCDECGTVEMGFITNTCNAHTHDMDKYIPSATFGDGGFI